MFCFKIYGEDPEFGEDLVNYNGGGANMNRRPSKKHKHKSGDSTNNSPDHKREYQCESGVLPPDNVRYGE